MAFSHVFQKPPTRKLQYITWPERENARLCLRTTKATIPSFVFQTKEVQSLICGKDSCEWMNVEINTSPCPRVESMDKGSSLLKAMASKNTWLEPMKIHTWISNTWHTHVSRVLHAYFMGTSHVLFTYFSRFWAYWAYLNGAVPWLPIGCSALGLNHLCESRGAL